MKKQAKPKKVERQKVVAKKVVPKIADENEATAQLQLKLEQEKVKKLQSILNNKQAIESRQNPRFLNRNKGVVTDSKTGLMWMACSLGQKWKNGTCVGEAEEYLWSEAVSLAKESRYADYSGWRLPTRDELHTIVDCTNGRVGYKLGANGKMVVKDGVPQNGKCLGSFKKPTIDLSVFPNTPASLYWSYSFNAKTNYSAWAVSFSGGYHYNYNTSNLGNVRLIRKSR